MSQNSTYWSIRLAIEQTTHRRWKSSSMDFQCPSMKPSTSWTTQRLMKDGDERPSNDRRNGSTCNPLNRGETYWSNFGPVPQNQIAWGDSLRLCIHPYPITTRWTRRRDQGRREDLCWLMTNLLRDINKTRSLPSPQGTDTIMLREKGAGTPPR